MCLAVSRDHARKSFRNGASLTIALPHSCLWQNLSLPFQHLAAFITLSPAWFPREVFLGSAGEHLGPAPMGIHDDGAITG